MIFVLTICRGEVRRVVVLQRRSLGPHLLGEFSFDRVEGTLLIAMLNFEECEGERDSKLASDLVPKSIVSHTTVQGRADKNE